MSLGTAVTLSLALTASVLAQDETKAGNQAISAPTWTRARAVWFGQGANPVAAALCVGAGAGAWADAARKSFERAAAGSRVAVGNEGWASLDSFNGFASGGAKV